jgi:hypothetical protein
MHTQAALTAAALLSSGGLFVGARPAAADVLFVAPNGSDAAACTQQAPCATFDRAYHRASPGQVVQVLGGTYPPQTVTADPAKDAATADVIIRSAPGQLAVLGGLVIRQAAHLEVQGSSVASPRSLAGASSGLTLMPTPGVVNSGADASITQCSHDVTLRDIDIKLLTINNSNRVSIIGGAIGGHNNTSGNTLVTPEFHSANQQICPDFNPSQIRISQVLFHDVSRELFPSAHPDCLQLAGTASIVIEKSYFIRCATADILARPATDIWSGAQLTGVDIRNNFLGPLTERFGNILGLGSQPDHCGDITIEYNTAALSGLSAFNCGSYDSLKVIGNYQHDLSQFVCNNVLGKAMLYDGNSIGFKENPTDASTCGTHSHLTGDPRFVDVNAFDFRLQRGSSLIGQGALQHPLDDIDGKPRPARVNADGGASQWEPSTLILGRAVGYLSLGMDESAVRAIYGPPSSVRPNRKGFVLEGYRLHAGELTLTYSVAALVGIAFTTPYYSSATGTGVGAHIPSWGGLKWVPCRKAFVRRLSTGVVEIIKPRGGRKGQVISELAMYRADVPIC